MKEAKIKHVFGNVLRIAIPLTLRTVELVDVDVDGEIEQQAQVTDTDFIPSSDYPVNVVFSKGAVKVSLKAQMRDGNIAYVEDEGTISVGTYDITVTCNDNDGNPYRFKQNTILQVVDATADAGIETPIEYEVTTWYLDAAIYLVMKGEDGVGIEDIITESSGEIGGVNTVTFVLTNGETRSFTILNGSGSVDSDFDENSLHPISNSVITNKFKSIDANISGLFGDVDYDSSSKILRFWDITKSTILATVDARPFVKDGMVNRVYIQNRTLVITFNTDSGHDTIAISLDSVFNPNNYYTRVQTDNRIADEISRATSGLMAKEDFVYEGSVNLKYGSAPEIVLSHIEGVSMYQEDHSRLFGASNGHIKGYVGAVGGELFDYGLAPLGLVFLDKTSGLFYRWNVIAWQQVGGSGSGGYEPPVGGIPKTDLAPAVQASLGKADTALQSSDLEGYATTDDVGDAVAALISSAPHTLNTLNELAEALGNDPNFATTMATQLGNKVDKETGKGLSTNDYTTAEKTKLAGLENYDDSALQTAINGKVDKESGKSLMTDAERTKLAGIAAGAEVNVQPNWTQTNTSADDYIKNKPTLATVATSGSYNDLSNKPTIPAAQVQSDWNATSGMGVILNKPTIPDTSTLATKTELNGKQDTINDLATIRINSGKGVADVSSNADGTVVTTLANGDTYTIDLNHEHPQYVESDDLADVATSGSYNDLQDKPTIPAGVTVDSTITQGGTNAVQGGAIYTALQGKADTADIPTKTSDLTNDSGFIDKAMYYGTSDTAAATMPKVCTVETFPTYTNNGVTHAKEGTIIAVKFTNSDTNTTAAPKLNVNSIGAKAIMYNNAIVTSTAKNTTLAGTAKMLAYYRYDPALDEGNGAWEYLGKSVDSNSTYSNASLGQGYGTQSNSAAATAITVTLSSYALSTGGIVSVLFTYDVPANATLNINSKGAKAIYNQGAAITAGVIKAGDTATFIYSTYYYLLSVDSWQEKQDAISDLATIRSGAALGASALQSYTETDPTVPAWAKASTKPTYTAQEVGALPASTTIPTKVSDLTNDSGFATTSAMNTALAGKQDTISNLSTIQSGAALGATSVQSVSVNGDTAVTPDANGNVDLTVSAGGGSSSAAFSINITSTTIEIQPMTGATMTVGTDVSFQAV